MTFEEQDRKLLVKLLAEYLPDVKILEKELRDWRYKYLLNDTYIK